ncbi:uncharacterized protein [Prorops nasuta]|uniref:uncharacterized protein n=1 Tax=Prorops nasuta TaxID=863751 RepID=UPI0034CFFDE5
MLLRQAISDLARPAVLAFGNPLLDIHVRLRDDTLLRKYGLKTDDEKELPRDIIEKLIADLPTELETSISSGGAAQNTLRVLQWLCDETHFSRFCIYCGGIGNDSNGTKLNELITASGIITRYAVQPIHSTGICVALEFEKCRSLVANLGAAAIYTLNDLNKSDLSLDSVKIVYLEGFFVVHSLDVAREIVKRAQEKKIIVAFNLNGVYIFKDHHAAICEMVGMAKIVFGNAREMTALAQALNLKFDDVYDIPIQLNNLKRITVDASNIASKDWLSDDSSFVMTHGGSAPSMIVWGKGENHKANPIVSSDPILNTTGAGDSFVAGFLAGILAQKSPQTCLLWGMRVASYIITKSGMKLPNNAAPYNLLE